MSLVIVETLADSPLAPEEPTDTDLRVLACLAERNGTWCYSLLSANRKRMICTFEAPDAEAVRESYRKGGGEFSQIWTGEIIQPQGNPPQPNATLLKVLEGVYPGGFTDEAWHEASRNILPCYAERGVEWVKSYVSLDRTRVVCELNAADAELIRETYHKLKIPFVRVWPALLFKPQD